LLWNKATPATRTPGTVSLADLAAQHPWNEWISFGARPEVFFTKHISLAFEGGVDHTHCIAGCVSQSDGPIGPYDGWLRKLTNALLEQNERLHLRSSSGDMVLGKGEAQE
jgi:hypothetical protein